MKDRRLVPCQHDSRAMFPCYEQYAKSYRLRCIEYHCVVIHDYSVTASVDMVSHAIVYLCDSVTGMCMCVDVCWLVPNMYTTSFMPANITSSLHVCLFVFPGNFVT